MSESNSQPKANEGLLDKKATTRAHILQAAMTCFAEKGYHRTTMDDIVAQSGLSKGALYWHFESKKDLFLSLVDWLVVDYDEAEILAHPAGMSADERLRTTVMLFADRFEQLAPFTKVMLDFWTQTFEDEQVRQTLASWMERFQRVFGVIVDEGVTSGEFRPVNGAQVAMLITGMLDSLWFYNILWGNQVDLQDSMNSALDVFLDGLKAKCEASEG